ncbi:molybdenum cofactor sulfurylase [Salinihabitans flavidus]|uniref:Molybdenum cofactor sulfurylase n=1 Tax=Salinihabitans flavidus TaxID=569882 RepID=A0A1H8RZI9_9RHOB|nr:molybdenum cofactor sulfurylase [Salinihabitans flavidus]
MFDRAALSRAVAAHGSVARVVIASVKGSAPREAGTAMLVWDTGFSGTIGGGRLEYEALAKAREQLAEGTQTRLSRMALGPAVNQCCGGAVTLVTECFDAARLAGLPEAAHFARPVDSGAQGLPNTAARAITRAEKTGTPMPTILSGGWLIEPFAALARPVYIHGAGHVGRALAQCLAPLPGIETHLVDSREDWLSGLPENIVIHRDQPAEAVIAAAPDTAWHYIMTPDHDADLALCHMLLQRDFAFTGLIGSATKWARFRSRLRALGHGPDRIARITCPIGDPALGKHPQAIAIGIAADLLNTRAARSANREQTA